MGEVEEILQLLQTVLAIASSQGAASSGEAMLIY